MKTLSVALPLLVGALVLLVGTGVLPCPLTSTGSCGTAASPRQEAASAPASGAQVATVRHIGVDEFEKLRSSGASLYMLDVREPFELTEKGRIPGVINIPLGEIGDRRTELPSDLETPIYTICQTGNRSKKGAAQLVALGYRNVYTLDGGTGEWIERQK